MDRAVGNGLAVVGLAGMLALPVRAQEEFSYRDLAPGGSRATEPLIPEAATSRGGISISAGTLETPPGDADLIPLAMASGSQAARIYTRNRRRVGLISDIFDRLKDAAREEAIAAERAEAERRRLDEARRARQREEAERSRLETEEQVRELARREDEARRRIESQARAAAAPQVPPAMARAAASTPRVAALAPRGLGDTQGGYVVQPGDSLIKIARTIYGTPKAWTRLAEANGLAKDSTIRAGDTLVLPSFEGRAAAGYVQGARQRAAQAAPAMDYTNYDYKLHNIQPGDSLSGIAAQYYGDGQGYQLIESYNAKVLAQGLRAGEKLVIPVPKTKAHQDRYQVARQGGFDWGKQGM